MTKSYATWEVGAHFLGTRIAQFPHAPTVRWRLLRIHCYIKRRRKAKNFDGSLARKWKCLDAVVARLLQTAVPRCYVNFFSYH